MKKLFICILAMVSLAGVAQTQYKFEKGSVAAELQFSSVNFRPFSIPGLRVRYAVSDRWVLRATLGLDFNNNRTKEKIDRTNDHYYFKQVIKGNYSMKSNYTEFSITPGFEYHFGKWERMSVFVGGELVFGLSTTQATVKSKITVDYYERDYYEEELKLVRTEETSSSIKMRNCYGGWGDYTQNGKMFFGINAFAGIDFYLYKGLYLGAELGLGYAHSIALKGSVKGNDNGVEIDKKFDNKIAEGKFAFKFNPMIRLGWRF